MRGQVHRAREALAGGAHVQLKYSTVFLRSRLRLPQALGKANLEGVSLALLSGTFCHLLGGRAVLFTPK